MSAPPDTTGADPVAATLCNAEKRLPLGTDPNLDCHCAATVPKLLVYGGGIQRGKPRSNIGKGKPTCGNTRRAEPYSPQNWGCHYCRRQTYGD